jgi:hypothetical protein
MQAKVALGLFRTGMSEGHYNQTMTLFGRWGLFIDPVISYMNPLPVLLSWCPPQPFLPPVAVIQNEHCKNPTSFGITVF